MDTMAGIVLDGRRPQLREDLPVPAPAAGEVLVRVTHATVNGHEIEVAASSVLRFLGKLFGARGEVQTGLEFAGVVRSDGERHRIGDEVLGYVDVIKGWKPHAELIAIREDYLAHRPDAVPPVDAAALPMSGQTALVALRDIADVQEGDSVLILGASGGVGVMAVQIARLLGAEVTAVATATHHPLLRELGADTVLDARELDLSAHRGAYELVFDLTTTHRYKHVRHLLAPRGSFIPADPLRSMFDVLFRRRARVLWVDKGDAKKLDQLATWAASGELISVIDEVFPLSCAEAAFARALARGKAGRVVLELSRNEP